MGEEYEPCNIKHNRTEKKYSISPAKALATALDRNKRKKRNHEIDHQHTIKQCTKGSNQSTTNLKVYKHKRSIQVQQNSMHLNKFNFTVPKENNRLIWN